MPVIVDLVADLGEAFGAYRMGDDTQLLEVITSANIACGFHAGDPMVMDQTVAECARRGVAVGAHPGFPDLVGFGRRAMDLSRKEIATDMLYQIGALHAFVVANNTTLTHITPHGRLGNLVVTDDRYAEGVLDAVTQYDPTLIVVTQPGRLADRARAAGVPVSVLGIADRAYNGDGTLVSRKRADAVITDAREVTERVVRMVLDHTVLAVDGMPVPVECDTVLLHGDTPGAVDLAHSIRNSLIAAGVTIAPMRAVLDAKGVR